MVMSETEAFQAGRNRLCYHVEAGRTGGIKNSNAEWLRAAGKREAERARKETIRSC